MFVVVEGIEGSGKSTLVAAIAGELRAAGRDVVVTREPGGTPLGDAVRDLFLNRALEISPPAESMLVNAARAQHVTDVIRPALAAGRVVLCDRFVDSTLAYQGYGRRGDLEALRVVCGIATGGLEADFTLVLDLAVGTARQRMRERCAPSDRIESEADAFHERVRQGFLELAKAPRHCVLDATRAPGELLERAMAEIAAACAP
jgi:dTMP kinase